MRKDKTLRPMPGGGPALADPSLIGMPDGNAGIPVYLSYEAASPVVDEPRRYRFVDASPPVTAAPAHDREYFAIPDTPLPVSIPATSNRETKGTGEIIRHFSRGGPAGDPEMPSLLGLDEGSGQDMVGRWLTTPWAPDGPWEVTQGYGQTDYEDEGPGHDVPHWHTGIDLAVPSNTPLVFPFQTGVAHDLNDPKGYGPQALRISLTPRVDIVLGHLVRRNTREEQRLRKGDVVGWADNLGNSSGPHLHFEVRLRQRGGAKQTSYADPADTDVDPVHFLTLNTSAIKRSERTGGPDDPSVPVPQQSNPAQGERAHLNTPDPGPHTVPHPGEDWTRGQVRSGADLRPAIVGDVQPPRGTGGPVQTNEAAAKLAASQDVCGFTKGNCTAYIAAVFGGQNGCICQNRSGFGDAATWLAAAKAHGWQTMAQPQAGWVGVWDANLNGSNGHGHVAIITGTDNGRIQLHSMNVDGVGVVSNSDWGTNNFAGSFRPPCDATELLNNPDLNTGTQNLTAGCPNWFSDPQGFLECVVLKPLGQEIEQAEKAIANTLIGIAQAGLGVLLLGGAVVLGVSALRGQRPGSVARRGARRLTRGRRSARTTRQPVQQPAARVARAQGSRAAPAPPRGVTMADVDPRGPARARSYGRRPASQETGRSVRNPTRSEVARDRARTVGAARQRSGFQSTPESRARLDRALRANAAYQRSARAASDASPPPF